MNNTIQKNIVLSLDVNNVMPHDNNVNRVNEFSTADINANFKQLLDNDLYINQSIIDNTSRQIGARYFDDNISSLPNGSKIWNEDIRSGDVIVYRKQDHELSDNIIRRNEGEVKLIKEFNDLKYVALSNGFRTTTNFSKYENVYNFPSELSVNCMLLNEYELNPIVGTNNGVYQYSNSNWKRLDEENKLSDVTSILRINNYDLIGTKLGTYIGNLSNDILNYEGYYGTGAVNDIAIRKVNEKNISEINKNIILACDNGLYHSDIQLKVNEFHQFKELFGQKVNSTVKFNGIRYFGTNQGLYKLVDEKIKPVEAITGNVRFLRVIEDYLVVCAGWSVWIISNDGDIVEKLSEDHTEFISYAIFKKYNFAASKDKIFLNIKNKDKWEELDISDKILNSEIVDIGTMQNMFYIVCSDKILGGDITDYDILTHKIKLDVQLNDWNVTGIFGKYIVRQNGTNAEIYSDEDIDRKLTTLTNVDSKVVAITETNQTIFVADETKVWVFDYNFENKDGPYEINTEMGDKIFDICTFDFGRKYVILTKHGYIGVILNNKIVYYDIGVNITSWYTDEYGKTLIVFTETGAYEISEKIIKTPILSAFTFDGNNIHGITNSYKVCNLYNEQRIEIGSMMRILTKDKRYNVKITNSENEIQTYEVTEAADGYDFIQPELQNSDRLWCITSGDNTIHVCENLSGIPGNELTEFALGHNSYGLIQTNQDDKIISYDDSNIYCSEKEIIFEKFLNQSVINGIFANTCTYQDTDDEGNPITKKTEILGLNINGSNKFSLIDNISGLVSTTLLNDTKKIRSYEKNLLGLGAGKIIKAPFQLTATLPDESDVKIKFNIPTTLQTITDITDFETDVNGDAMYLMTENTSGVNFLVGSLSDIVENLSSHTDYTNHFSKQPLSSNSRFKKLTQLSSNLGDEIEICHIGINTKNGVWYKPSNLEYQFYNFTSESEIMNGFELTENGIVALISKDEQKYLKFRKYGDVSNDKIISNIIPSNINITDIFGDTNETYKDGTPSNNVIYGHDDNNNVYNIEYSDTTGYKLVSTPYYTASPDDKNIVIYDTELIIIRNDGIYKKLERQKYDKLTKLHEVAGNDLRSVQIYDNKIITLQDDYIKVYDFNSESGPELNVSLSNKDEKLGFFIKDNEYPNTIGYIHKKDNKTYIDGWEFDQLSELDNKRNEFSYIIEKDNINSIYTNNEILIDGKNPFLLLGDTGIEYINSYEENRYAIGVLTEFENIDGVIVGVQTNDNNYFFKDDGLYIPVINDDNKKQLSLYIGNEQLGIKDGETVTECFSSNNVLIVKVGQDSIIQIYDLHNKLSDRTDGIKVNGIINEDQMIIGNGNGLFKASNIIRTDINFIEKYSGDVDGKNKIRRCTFLNDKIHTKQYSETVHENEYVQIFDYSYNLSKYKFDIPVYGGMEDDTLINDIFYYQIENKNKSHIIYDNNLIYYEHGKYNDFPIVINGINNVVYDNEKNIFYILTNGGLQQYKDVSNRRVYVNEIPYQYAGTIFSIFKITDTEFILCTEKNGLVHYTCDYINNIRKYEDSILNTGITKKIVERVINGDRVYFTSVDNKIYSSDRLSRWKLFLTLPETVSYINDFYINSYYDMAFATNDGIYRPQYKFDLINDYPKFTALSAEQMFIKYEDEVDSYISSLIEEHEKSLHNDKNAPITLINTLFEPNEFNDIRGWTKTESDEQLHIDVISNDIIKNIYSNESLGNLISLSVQNFYTNNELTEIGGIDYILKRYNSNLFELFIHVPTTMTYYLPHVDDVFGCDVSSIHDVLERKNLPRNIMYQNSEISSHFTTIKMSIDDSILSIENVFDTEINGMSLPLKVYRDNENICGNNGIASSQFHSLILPSVQGYSTNYNYTFYVFGTDEQTIRIFGRVGGVTKYEDDQKETNYYTYTIKFNGNGGEGEMMNSNQRSDMEFKLPENRFRKVGFNFIGWKDSQGNLYADGQIITNPMTNQQTITLIAQWEQVYQFDDNVDNVIQMNSNMDKFTIAGGDIASGYDQIIIDFGE